MCALTWGIKQHHVVSCVKTSSFHQGCCDFLSSLVKLCAGGCAHWHPLQEIKWRYRPIYPKPSQNCNGIDLETFTE